MAAPDAITSNLNMAQPSSANLTFFLRSRSSQRHRQRQRHPSRRPSCWWRVTKKMTTLPAMDMINCWAQQDLGMFWMEYLGLAYILVFTRTGRRLLIGQSLFAMLPTEPDPLVSGQCIEVYKQSMNMWNSIISCCMLYTYIRIKCYMYMCDGTGGGISKRYVQQSMIYAFQCNYLQYLNIHIHVLSSYCL